MAQYLPTKDAPASFPPGWDKCQTPGAGSSAVAYDITDDACYPIEGLAVVIGPYAASVQGLFDVYNYNVSMNGDQPAVANSLQLNKIGVVV